MVPPAATARALLARSALVGLLVTVAPACTSTLSAAELSRMLREQDVRTIALEATCTVVSPYSAQRTVPFVKLVEENLAAVSALFDVVLPGPVMVFLEAEEMEETEVEVDSHGREVHISGLRPPHRHGVLGAFGGNELSILVIVPRDREVVLDDGRTMTGVFLFDHEGTVRHEVAHLCARLAGLEGPTWFDEGLALEVESWRHEHGRRVPRAGDPIAIARDLPRRSVATLLDWEEDGADLLAGRADVFLEGRPLAHALMRFLLERVEGGDLVERLRAVLVLSRAELLRLEPAWHRWLDGGSGGDRET
jgi:hypothetical protein